MEARTKNKELRTKNQDKSQISDQRLSNPMNKCIPISFCVKKLMKAERNVAADTLRGTLLLRMATLGTLAKQRRCHPEGSLPSSFKTHAELNRVSSQKGTS